MKHAAIFLCPIMSAVITEPSICIPRTLNNITWSQVKDTFEHVIGKGTVERVDIVSSKNNEPQPFCRIFVHFRYWPNTPDVMAIRQRLINGEVIKVVYDNPWFWKCSASRIAKPVKTAKTPPFIECTGESVTPSPDVTTPSNTTADEDGRSSSPCPMPHAPVRATRPTLPSQVVMMRQPNFDTTHEPGAEQTGEAFSDA